MQVPRYWRMQGQRYRLEGYRNSDDSLSLQPKPMTASERAVALGVVGLVVGEGAEDKKNPQINKDAA